MFGKTKKFLASVHVVSLWQLCYSCFCYHVIVVMLSLLSLLQSFLVSLLFHVVLFFHLLSVVHSCPFCMLASQSVNVMVASLVVGE